MVVAVATLLALSGCTPTSEVVEGTSVTVALGESFTSVNPNTAYGTASATNRSVYAATNSTFASYDETPQLVQDESFGTYQVVTDEPLVVTYTIREGVRWSDGAPVDAADLLLAWAANSTSLNEPDFDPAKFVDTDGRFTEEFPRDVVYFDGFTGNGLQLVTETPELGADGRSITLSYDKYFADWNLVFEIGLPAHVVAEHALRLNDDESAKDAVISAIQTKDTTALAAISRFWNSGFNLSETPDDPDLLVSNGPYTISEIAEDRMTLVANPEYRGIHLPQVEKVSIRFINDPLQSVAALQSGEVDIVAPQATEDVIAALAELEGATVEHGFTGTGEWLDLQFAQSKNGQIENLLVRQAFLKTVPRQEILETLIRPLNPDAALRSSHTWLPGTEGYEQAVEVNGSRSYARVDIAGAKRTLARAAEEFPALAHPTVCVLFDPANPRRVAEFQLIAASAEQAGFIITNCSSPDWRNLLGTPNSYDAALYALRETNLSLSAVVASFSRDSTINNHSHYANPSVEALLGRVSGPLGGKERRSLLTEIDTILWSDAIGVPLYQFPTVTAIGNRVTGVTHSPFAPTVLWNPWDWKPVLPE